MAYLLRGLLLLMVAGVLLTMSSAFGLIELPLNHIQIAIPVFLFTIFAQAFVMFYFIGVSRLINNIWTILSTSTNLDEIFESAPADLTPYTKKVEKFVFDSTRCKRQTIPWTMMMLILGMIAFLLGGAHDTNLVEKTTHSGVVYGFFAAMAIGFFRQWFYLGKSHILLRKVKSLFEIPDGQM
ncbi:MAG: hypothetical protein KC493_04645 [Bacteriovoracaceae bacterium]|nr:hypothetical protein [Bacteriovoracaceae bacterium]